MLVNYSFPLRREWRGTFLSAAVGALLTVLPVSAQITATGNLSGRVTDKSQAVVHGAVVKLTGAGSGLQREVKSSDEGLYSFELLPAGAHHVTPAMPRLPNPSFHTPQVALIPTPT